MKGIINDLLELVRSSELLQVELIAFGIILLLLLLRLFEFRVGHLSYVSVVILILFPLLWFAGKGIVNLFKQINIPKETWPWIWVSLGVLALLILVFIFRKSMAGMRRPRTGFSWLWIGIPLLVIAGIWGYKQYQISRFLSGLPNNSNTSAGYTTTTIKSSSQLNTKGENFMKVGETRQFTFSYDGPTYYFSPKGCDTVILTFSGNGTSWKREISRDKDGVVHRRLIGTRPPAFAGTCLVSTNKDAIVVVEEKVE